MHPGSILCRFFLFGTLLLAPLQAQTHKVEAPEKVTRALAVYEWTGDLDHPSAARLVPVSLFIHGYLEDAGVYLAQPIPFALQPGDIYSIERSGQPIGTFELNSASDVLTRHSSTSDSPLSTWYGYGQLLSGAAEKVATKAQTNQTQPITDIGPDDAPPVLRRNKPDSQMPPKKAGKQSGYVTPPITPLNDDPNRPTLHRGIPANADIAAPLTNLPPALHQSTAISDAIDRAPQTFARPWTNPAERTKTLAALEALSRPRLTHYIAFDKFSPIHSPQTPGHSFTDTATNVSLSNEQLLGYTLNDGALPTFIYTAEVSLTNGGPVYLTLVAQAVQLAEPANALSPDNFHMELLSITDAGHLDRTPWLRPIDAVDPDASRTASLLFELRAQSTRQFVLYSLSTSEAVQTLVTTPIE